MCGLGQCSNRTLWKSWFSCVNRTGSKCVRQSRISAFTARARATSAGPISGAERAVAAPSTMLSVCIV